MFDDWKDQDERTTPNNRPVVGVNGDETRRPDVTTQINHAPVPTTPYYSDLTLPPPLARESAARERMRKRRVKGRRAGGEWAWVIIAFAMLGVVITISMSVFLLLRTSQEDLEVIPTAAAVLPTPVDARSDFADLNGGTGAGQALTLDDGRSIVLQPWNGNSRFTVLVMGLDRRISEDGLAYRTDTMMLVSLDPATHSIGILSLPRDLYVVIPGYGERQRINSALVLGELQQPGYGPTLAMQTAQYNFGIRVHDYVAVDFNAFITFVDVIGGIDVDVPYTINDPEYPNMYFGYEPFFLEAGFHHLNGVTALKYARTRHQTSDFERAQRQQQVLYAIRDRVLDLEMLPQLIVQAPSMWSNLEGDIYTGLTMDQIIQLSWYLKDIPSDSIRTGVVDETYTMGYMTNQGAAVLIPDQADLGPLMVEVFGANYSE
jgi:polyisoprenyl-teichoic acid--peptidoglycan teichoic acid transferase